MVIRERAILIVGKRVNGAKQWWGSARSRMELLN
jgi:hypothetical protein